VCDNVCVDPHQTVIRGGFKAENPLGHITRKASCPLPSPPSPPLISFSLPSPSFSLLLPLISSPFPLLPLEVGPWNPAGCLGSAVSSPSGSGAEPRPKSNLVHFSLKIWHLSKNQLNKFHAVWALKVNCQSKVTNFFIKILKEQNAESPYSFQL